MQAFGVNQVETGAPGARDATGAVTVPSKFSLCAGAAAGLCHAPQTYVTLCRTT